MTSNVKAIFSQQIDDDGETPMFIIEKNDSLRIRRGLYSIKMSYYNRKVYFHIQNNAKGTSTSLPEEVMLAMAGLGDEIAAVRDFVKSLQPPSPPMKIQSLRHSCVVALKKETVKLKSSADFLLEEIDKTTREVDVDEQQLEIIKNRMADICHIHSLRHSFVVELYNETVKLKSSADVLLEEIEKKKRELNVDKQQLEIITNRMSEIYYYLCVVEIQR